MAGTTVVDRQLSFCTGPTTRVAVTGLRGVCLLIPLLPHNAHAAPLSLACACPLAHAWECEYSHMQTLDATHACINKEKLVEGK